ncbi:hypothetical protein ACTMTU_13085 [Streptomyces sp. OZ13]|uniref:hypothetical protein n=1 Tax=Streptomyces sp. OZ13 TaxID=3452210 RepID=UPI003F8BE07B
MEMISIIKGSPARTGHGRAGAAVAQAGRRRRPRDAGPARVREEARRAAEQRGRPRKFRVSRAPRREQAHAGSIPGVGTSCW